jgi:phosphoserine phosphatase
MMAYAFTMTAAAEYEEAGSKNQEAATEKLWTLLAAKLYNADQVSATRTAFNSVELRRGETIQAYALRLKGLSRGLPDCKFEEIVKQRFVSSITPSMWKDARLVSGALDFVVSKMVQLEAINAVARGTGELRAKREGDVVGTLWTRGRSDQDICHAQQSEG